MASSGFMLQILDRALWITSALLPNMLPIIELLIQSVLPSLLSRLQKDFLGNWCLMWMWLSLNKYTVFIWMVTAVSLFLIIFWVKIVETEDGKDSSLVTIQETLGKIIVGRNVCIHIHWCDVNHHTSSMQLYGTGYRVNCLINFPFSHWNYIDKELTVPKVKYCFFVFS